MLYKNLDAGKIQAIKRIAANYNTLRQKRAAQDGLESKENRVFVEEIKTESGSSDLRLDFDNDDFYSDFAGNNNMPKGKYRLVGSVARNASGQGHLMGTFSHSFSISDGDASKLTEQAKHMHFGKCDCCGANRRRDRVYVVENVNNHQYFNLGSDCVDAVCTDKDFMDMLKKIDDVIDGKVKTVGKGSKDKVLYDPKKFMACALTVSELDLPSFMSCGKFKKKDINTDADLIKHSFQALSGYHTYADNSIKFSDGEQLIFDNKALSSGTTELKPSALCEWTKAVYQALYADDKPSQSMAYLLDITNFKQKAESMQTDTKVLSALTIDPEFYRKGFCTEDGLVSEYNRLQMSVNPDDEYTASACEDMIRLLNDYMILSEGRDMYSSKITLKGNKSQRPYFEKDGRCVKAIDLEKHGIDINRSNLNEILSKGHISVPAANRNGILVPSYDLKIYDNGTDKVDLKKVACSVSFSDGSSTGYYYENDTEKYVFMNHGRAMYALDDSSVRNVFGEDPSVDTLMTGCQIASIKRWNSGNLEILSDLEDRCRYDGKMNMPILYNKQYHFDSGAAVTIKQIHLDDYVVLQCDSNKGRSCRLCAVSDLNKCMSNSTEYVKDCVGRVAAMYDSKEFECFLKMRTAQNTVDFKSKNGHISYASMNALNEAKRGHAIAFFESKGFERQYKSFTDIDSAKMQFYAAVPNISFFGDGQKNALIPVDRSVSTNGKAALFDISDKHISADVDKKSLYFPPDVKNTKLSVSAKNGSSDCKRFLNVENLISDSQSSSEFDEFGK